MGSPGTTRTTSRLVEALPELAQGQRRVYLVRHGETDWNARGLMQGGGFDIPLNDRGKLQSAALAEEMASLPIDLVASSHLSRAFHTAEDLRQSRKQVPHVVKEEFGEMRCGKYEGSSLREPENKEFIQSLFSSWASDPSLAWPCGSPDDVGESPLDVASRGTRGLEELLYAHPDCRHVAVFAHGRFNKILMASLVSRDVSMAETIRQGNTCISVLDVAWGSQLGTQAAAGSPIERPGDEVPEDDGSSQKPSKLEERSWTQVLVNYVGHTEGI